MILLRGPEDPTPTRRQFLTGSGALTAAGLAGCLGGDDGGSDGDGDADAVVEMHQLALESGMYIPPLLYGKDQGVFEERGIDISFEVVGFGKYSRAFTDGLATGTSNLSALPLMEQIATDAAPAKIFGQAMNLINQCFVRADSDVETVADLEGRVLGVPGLGSSTVRAYKALWAEQLDFDLENDPAELVDSPPGTLYEFITEGEEVDAVILFTSFTIAALANPDLRSIYHPGTRWEDETGYPPIVTAWGVFEDFLEANPQAVLDFQEGWRESVDLFRENYGQVMSDYAERSGLGVRDDEDQLAVVQEMVVENREFFPQEWGDGWAGAVVDFGEAVEAQGGIEAAPVREDLVTAADIESMT